MIRRGEDAARFRETQVLFREAMLHEPSSRERVVRERAAGDENLFAEVMELLAHAGGDELFPPHSPASPGELRTLAGERKRYELLEVLGEGGMGIVYLARQLDPIRRRVALKVVKLGVESKGARARFEFERQALAMMDHPHIARVYEAGTTADGRLYFAMEHVPGLPLTEYCDRLGMSVRERLALFCDVCRALQHAHQKGIIHRDVKPSNILVSDGGGKPVPKIIDFGVARTVDFRLTENTFVTQLGGIVGSLRYMSPEQADGRRIDIDTRTDIYSLGAVLYELLTGSTPFDDDPDVCGFGELQQRIREDEPDRPSLRVLSADIGDTAKRDADDCAQLARELRGDLDWITMKALEKERLRRYQTANELADDLERFLANQPVAAGPPGAKYRLGKFVRRHRTTVVAASVVTLTVLVALAATTALYIDNQRGMRLAQRQHAEILRLSDAVRLAACVEGAQQFYPPHPSMVPRMRDWLAGDAADLAARLVHHRETLERLKVKAAAIGAGGRVEFNDPELQFHYDLLSRLVKDLERFVDPDPAVGTIASVRQRLEFSKVVYERSVLAHRAEWERAARSIADVAACPAYDGLVLEPQVGLVPIGQDPNSGLWEFAHLQSGAPASRDADAQTVVTAESGIVLVLIPGGCFWMGSDSAQSTDPRVQSGDHMSRLDERPPHEVCLEPFFISKYEVTQAQWRRVADRPPGSASDLARVPTNSREIHPAAGVDWETARSVSLRMGMDLPTEAQWEYAARSGMATPWPSGSDVASVEPCANLLDLTAKGAGQPGYWRFASWSDGYATAAPVGSFLPNRFGLHDVIGNVWEWCRDLYAPYSNPVTPGEGERSRGVSQERVARGGGFHTIPIRARVSFRADLPAANTDRLGVRPVRRIDPVEGLAASRPGQH